MALSKLDLCMIFEMFIHFPIKMLTCHTGRDFFQFCIATIKVLSWSCIKNLKITRKTRSTGNVRPPLPVYWNGSGRSRPNKEILSAWEWSKLDLLREKQFRLELVSCFVRGNWRI